MAIFHSYVSSPESIVFVWGNDDPAGMSIHLEKNRYPGLKKYQSKRQQIDQQIGMNDNFGMLTNQNHIVTSIEHLNGLILDLHTSQKIPSLALSGGILYLLRLCLEHT